MAYQGKHTSGARTAKRNTKKTPAGKVVLTIAIVLLVLILLFSIGAAIVHRMLNKINRSDGTDIVSPENATDLLDPEDMEATDKPPEVDGDSIDWGNIDDLEVDENLINILLVGQDSRTGQRERSDSMIVISVNTETGEVAMVSFMRDLYVQMPEGYMDNRMNAAYAYGGFEYLYEVLMKNFGLKCSGGFEVNFDGFTDVVNTMGGVDIELSPAEARVVGEGAVAGMNHLNGSQALTYARIRKIDSDFNRTARQRKVLTALFEKIKDSDLNTLLKLTDTLLPLMTTDMNNTQIISLVMKLAPLMSGMELNSYRIPIDGSYYDATIRGMMVLVPDLAMNRNYLKDVLPYSD